jgi:hypothetical protein
VRALPRVWNRSKQWTTSILGIHVVSWCWIVTHPYAGVEQESNALSIDLILELRKQFVEGDGGDADADIREAVGED